MLAMVAAACAHPGLRPEKTTRVPPGRETGLASYYARSLQGRRTASGLRYDGSAMTCAHPTLPFGTMLRVTDLETGRSVLVKVIDRGPYVHGRIVDLSWAAARALGIIDRGVARVQIERADE